MNIPIIASSFIGISKALHAMGYQDMSKIIWNRSPVLVNGVWRAEIHHG